MPIVEFDGYVAIALQLSSVEALTASHSKTRLGMEMCQGAHYPFDRVRVYEIHVVGRVDSRMFEWMSGTISARLEPADDPDAPVTVLTGRLSDQAALNGVLNTLYDRGYTLTLVRQVPDRPDEAQ